MDANLNAGQIVGPKLDGRNAQKVWNFYNGYFYHPDRPLWLKPRPLSFFRAVHFGPDSFILVEGERSGAAFEEDWRSEEGDIGIEKGRSLFQR